MLVSVSIAQLASLAMQGQLWLLLLVRQDSTAHQGQLHLAYCVLRGAIALLDAPGHAHVPLECIKTILVKRLVCNALKDSFVYQELPSLSFVLLATIA